MSSTRLILAHLLTPVLFNLLFFVEQRVWLESGYYLPRDFFGSACMVGIAISFVVGGPLNLAMHRIGWLTPKVTIATGGLLAVCAFGALGFYNDGPKFPSSNLTIKLALVLFPGMICGSVYWLLAYADMRTVALPRARRHTQ